MKNATLKIFATYIFVILLIVVTATRCSGQVTAVYFNADWNSSNGIEWFGQLSNVEKQTMDISKGDCQKKYQIAIVPTIIIFNENEEIKRFQADLSFKMAATKNEVQEYIDEVIISQF